MTATVPVHPTVAPATPTGPLTVPLEIIRAAGARHRDAVAEHDALPAWALLAVVAFALGLISFAIAEWRTLGSPLLIACALIGAAAAFAPDVIAARKAR